MLYSYAECKEKYKTDYQIRKELSSGRLKRLHRGIYSDTNYISDLAIISKTYPNAVFTLHSAFFFQNLTDTVPDIHSIITDKDAAKIKDVRIKQYFDNNNSLKLGVETKIFDGTQIRVFNRERLLVELIRHKNKLPFDYYKEIILNYRKLIYELDIQAIQEYASILPKTHLVMDTLRLEVF